MRKTTLCRMAQLLAVSLAIAASSGNAYAVTERVLYGFTGGSDGGNPACTLVFDSRGAAYGTTSVGGDFGFGTVFQLTRDQQGNWNERVLYSFQAGPDGKNPFGGVTMTRNGDLYGTTVAGGNGDGCTGDGCGTIFKLTRSGDNWTESVVYRFTGGNDGFGPGSALAVDANGILYGMTPDGGEFSAGTVFELVPSATGHYVLLTIHPFTGGDDGGTGSLGPLLVDVAGNLYGVTETGGANAVGTVFKMSRAQNGQWNFTTLYAFQGQPDAAFPYGGVILDSAGNLYGTTYFGGVNGLGSVFRLHPVNGGWQESVLYSFAGGTDGSLPTSPLTFDAQGNLYGTTSTGGIVSCDCGTVFELTFNNGNWNENVVYRFQSAPDGASPNYGLIFDTSGNLYGTTPVGGGANHGAIVQLNPGSNLHLKQGTLQRK